METPPPADAKELERDRDELLCLRCQRGERAAWNELVERWERPLHYFLRRLTRTEADAAQALQETWLQVVSSLPGLREPRRLAPWLYTVARRAAGRERRTAIEPEVLPEADGFEDPAPPAAEHLDRAEAVHWGLGRLPPAQAELLSLFFLDHLTLRELAEVLGVPTGTVKSRLHAARSALRDLLGPAHDLD